VGASHLPSGEPVRAGHQARTPITDHRAAHYRVGERWSLEEAVAADTLAAIVMAESWFDHRGLCVDPTAHEAAQWPVGPVGHQQDVGMSRLRGGKVGHLERAFTVYRTRAIPEL
jgi:hypothetical protein